MTKDDPITSALVDKFFDPVFEAESDEALREWLRHQPLEEIERFLNFWDWANERDRETILRQEISRRRQRASAEEGAGKRPPTESPSKEPPPQEVLKITRQGVEAIGRFPILIVAGLFLIVLIVLLAVPDFRNTLTTWITGESDIVTNEGQENNGDLSPDACVGLTKEACRLYCQRYPSDC